MAMEFPKFWTDLEQKMDVYCDDFVQVKSVVTALGYLTKTSIASINSKKKIFELENEYMKLRGNIKKFEISCERFPCLKEIDSFSPGLKIILTDIVNHLNVKKHDFEDWEAITEKILFHGKKVFI